MINFGIIYGMGPAAAREELGISLEEAQSYIDSYFARYPGGAEFIDATLEARETATSRPSSAAGATCRSCRAAKRGVRQFAERAAVNTPDPGLGGRPDQARDGRDRAPPRRASRQRRAA